MAGSDDVAALWGQLTALLIKGFEGALEAVNAASAKIPELELSHAKLDNVAGVNDPKASRAPFKRASAVHQSRLLSLPPEIRNMIWKLCLFHPQDLAAKLDEKLGGKLNSDNTSDCLTMTIDLKCDEARPKVRELYANSVAKRTRRCISELSLRNLGIMQTCQAIYNETAPFLWSQRFYFPSIMHLQAFLFSEARLDLVRDISVRTLDRQFAVNYMPAISAVLADKAKGLELFDVDMSCMDKAKNRPGPVAIRPPKRLDHEEEIRKAGTRLGFDVYSCMHPWVSKVVRDQGIERLMAILQIPRMTRKTFNAKGRNTSTNWRVHSAFRDRGRLGRWQRKVADTATAEEILRLVNHYDK